MLRSSREKFSTGPFKDRFGQIITEAAFEEATLAAILELQSTMPTEATPNQAADAHQQMIGARKYLDTLLSIHKPVTQTKPEPARGLNYEAGV